MSQTIETRLLLRFNDKASAGVKSVDTAFKGLSRSIVGYAGAFLSVRALMRTTTEAFKYAASIRDIADAFKMSTDFMSGMAIAGDAYNLRLDQMAKLFRFINVRMNEATKGAANARRAFHDLGVSFDELSKLSQEDRIFKIFDAVSKMRDPQQQAAALQGIGSEEAVKFLPMLAHGPDFLRNLMGMTGDSQLSKEQTMAVKQMQIEMAAMSRGLKNEWLKALLGMSGDLKSGFEWLKSDGFPMMRDSIRGVAIILRGMNSLLEAILQSSAGRLAMAPFRFVYNKLEEMYAAYATIDSRQQLQDNQGAMRKTVESLRGWVGLGVATDEEKAMLKRMEQTLAATDQVLRATAMGLTVSEAGKYIDEPKGQSPKPVDSKMDDFRAGWGQTMKEIENKWTDSWGNMTAIGRSSAELIARTMGAAMDNFFFDAIDGKLKQFKEYLLSFLRDIARALTQVMTQRIVIGALSGMGISMPQTQPTGLSKASGFSQPNVTIMNNSGMPVEGSASMGTDNMGNAVMSIVLDAVSRNKGGSRSMLRGMLA